MKISKKIVGLVALSAAGISSSAFAIVPPAVATSITGIQTDGQAIFDLVFPVIAVFVGLGVVVTLFKRFTKKL